ncbi:MAG: hypothetical protein P4L16_04460 [Chlamydiales bacterium]|nr:hypothetical protein [Chlamydiales bacterium]
MKFHKHLIYLTYLILCISSLLLADCPHHLYIAPDLLYRHYSEQGLSEGAKSDEHGILSGLQIGYDYITPRNVYVGADLRCDAGKTVYDGTLINLIDFSTSPYKNHTNNVIFNAEVRLGYTYEKFYNITTIPFIGFGYHRWYRGAVPENPFGYDETYTWSYLAFGMRTEYDFCCNLAIGLNLKLMFMIDGRMTSSGLGNDVFALGNKIQYEIELPITYRLSKPYWLLNQIQFVPYFRNQNIGRSNDQYAYLEFPGQAPQYIRVFEPESITYVAGARLELIHNF